MVINWDDYSQYMAKHVPNQYPDIWMELYSLVSSNMASWKILELNGGCLRKII